ncbi:hypothetical protein BD311DRAFT_750217 [Dichomitus squalens]|uniref:Uncharacterized protein n=1 Tax=Dichomitus squalens TaxID=114155 RepID=A0A4Q9MYD0_9APHY|nr:hypothetical protein BD311DRAFT_750217 [Dichomitus squalens]
MRLEGLVAPRRGRRLLLDRCPYCSQFDTTSPPLHRRPALRSSHRRIFSICPAVGGWASLSATSGTALVILRTQEDEWGEEQTGGRFSSRDASACLEQNVRHSTCSRSVPLPDLVLFDWLLAM